MPLRRVSLPRISVLGCGTNLAGNAGCAYQQPTSLCITHPSRSFPLCRQRLRASAMNFVDVQPSSFLDYAWTSPSPSAAAMNASKSSKTSRKQNRCCDQCRKGKRACDATILEDTLLEGNTSGTSPTRFHYSGESLCCR
jgi:hypothetical protein